MPTVTCIGPVPGVEPAGTEVVMLVDVEAVTIAVTPLMVTLLSPGIVLNPVPVMVIEVPIAPLVGVKEVIIVGIYVKEEIVEAMLPLVAASAATLAATLTVTGPAAAGVMLAV